MYIGCLCTLSTQGYFSSRYPGIFENVYILKIDSLRGIRRILRFDPGVTVFFA